jgi:hypothetical protein
MFTLLNLFGRDLVTLLKTTTWDTAGDLLAWKATDWLGSEVPEEIGEMDVAWVRAAELQASTGEPYLVAVPSTDDMSEVMQDFVNAKFQAYFCCLFREIFLRS